MDVARICSVLAQTLPFAAAEAYAVALVEDMTAIGHSVVVSPPSHSALSLPFAEWIYHVEGTAFGPENLEKPIPKTFKAAGFGLNLGNIHHLVQTCQTGRRVLGPKWYLHYQNGLFRKGNHLTAVEEIWWLGLWNAISDVCPNATPFKKAGQDQPANVDWRFRCGHNQTGQHALTTINLEVKLRQNDWLRVAYGSTKYPFRRAQFVKIAPKFTDENPGEINIAGLTILGPIDSKVKKEAEQFLAATPNLHAVILWSMQGVAHFEWTYVAAKTDEIRTVLNQVFNGGNGYDRQTHMSYIIFPREK